MSARRPLGTRGRERGVALITAVLIAALATTAAVAMASRQQFDIRRSGNVIHHDQAYVYAIGVESWARQILARDRRDSSRDYLGEDWATLLPPLPVEGGEIAGRLEDLQGRFNLNNLVNQEGAASNDDLKRFQRLLRLLDLDPALATAVVDWIDADSEPHFPDGAEDSEYLGREPPYRAANTPMRSASELRMVKGFTREAYERLAPFVTALPVRTKINVNTAPAEVLASLAENFSVTDATALVEARGDEGYETEEDFLQEPAVRALWADNLELKELLEQVVSVSSDFFLLHAEARIGSARVPLKSVLHRTAGGNNTIRVQVWRRAQTEDPYA